MVDVEKPDVFLFLIETTTPGVLEHVDLIFCHLGL